MHARDVTESEKFDDSPACILISGNSPKVWLGGSGSGSFCVWPRLLGRGRPAPAFSAC